MKIIVKTFGLMAVFAVAALTKADDGILYGYGAPRLMHGESSIRMVREVVRAKVYRDHSDVRCLFVFHNDGPAINAKIGFPDGSDHNGEDGDEIVPILKNFRSKVDGKWVPLKILKSQKSAGLDTYTPIIFHAKTVHFGRHQTRIIEDSYRAPLSGGGTSSIVQGPHEKGNLYISQFTYIMQSGGSWKGNIDEATLQVDFMEKSFRRLKAVEEREFGDPNESTRLASLSHDRVIWRSFAKPITSGNRMTFHRRSFKPTGKDNVSLTFDWFLFENSYWNRR